MQSYCQLIVPIEIRWNKHINTNLWFAMQQDLLSVLQLGKLIKAFWPIQFKNTLGTCSCRCCVMLMSCLSGKSSLPPRIQAGLTALTPACLYSDHHWRPTHAYWSTPRCVAALMVRMRWNRREWRRKAESGIGWESQVVATGYKTRIVLQKSCLSF